MTTSKMEFVDTNVLVYAADSASPFHRDAVTLRDQGLRDDIPICISPQVLNEFFAIVTDPRIRTSPTYSTLLLNQEKGVSLPRMAWLRRNTCTWLTSTTRRPRP